MTRLLEEAIAAMSGLPPEEHSGDRDPNFRRNCIRKAVE